MNTRAVTAAIAAAVILTGCGGKDAKDKTGPAVVAADTVAAVPDTAAAGSKSDDLLDKLLNIDRNAPFNSGDFLRSCRESRNRSRYYRSPDTAKITLTGNRSKLSVGRVINKDIATLRYVYNRRLRDKPYLSGTITVTFAIDESGKVISAQVVESTANDTTLENGILRTIQESHSPNPMDGSMRWYFGEIDKPGDTTVVTYPFTFVQ